MIPRSQKYTRTYSLFPYPTLFRPQYLEASMSAFHKNQQDVRAACEGALGSGNPLAELTRRNMEMFQQAAGAFMPGAMSSKSKDAEIDALKAEIAQLKAELARKK